MGYWTLLYVMEVVTHTLFLGVHVEAVILIGYHLYRNVLNYFESIAL